MMEQKSVKCMINNVTLYGYTQLDMGASLLTIRVHFARCLPVAAQFPTHSPTWKCTRLSFSSDSSDVVGRNVCFGAPYTFPFDVLPIHTLYQVEDVMSQLAHPYHLATNCVDSWNASSIGNSG